MEDLTFADCVEEDSTAINKRAADGINEIMVVECTALAIGTEVSFEKASKEARDKLAEDVNFEMAIDVKRCRGNKILPLPTRIMEDGQVKIVEFKAEQRTEKPEELITTTVEAMAVENVMTKQKMWEMGLALSVSRRIYLDY